MPFVFTKLDTKSSKRQRKSPCEECTSGPLQMIGLCLLYADKSEEAFDCYAAAHVENVISDGPVGATMYGAYYSLNKGYGVSQSDLTSFSNWITVQTDWDPYLILRKYEQKIGAPLSKLAQRLIIKIQWQQLTIAQMPGEPSKRVFLAGSYGNILWLKRIENAIIELGNYYPVLAINFVKPPGMITDDFTTQLLSRCNHAVFEISELGRGGFLTELPRARDLKIDCIGIYQSSSGRQSNRFTEEIGWWQKEPYISLEKLKDVLGSFLSEKP